MIRIAVIIRIRFWFEKFFMEILFVLFIGVGVMIIVNKTSRMNFGYFWFVVFSLGVRDLA